MEKQMNAEEIIRNLVKSGCPHWLIEMFPLSFLSKRDDLSFEALKIHGYPEWLNNMFPLTLIYYRASKPRQRIRNLGWDGTYVQTDHGKKIKWTKRKGEFRKPATTQQNNFSYMSCCLLSPDDVGTVSRSIRHKGYRKIIAAVYPTDAELEHAQRSWRYKFRKYKSMSEFYNLRLIDDPALKTMCEELDKNFPSLASGQLRLI